jgi:serine/threonine protein kinase
LPALLSKIKKGKYFPVPQYVPEGVRDLIERCLVTDPAKRITLDEILVHPCLATIAKKYNNGIAKPVGEDDSKSKKKDKKTKNKLLALAKSNSLDKIGKEDSAEELPIRSEIVEQLQVLGWKESEIMKSLKSSKPSMIKTVYRLVYEHESVPTEMIYSRAIEYKDEIELETSDSMKRRSMSISANPLKGRQSLKNSAPARANSSATPPEPAGISSAVKSADSSNDASDLDIKKARRTLSDRRQVVRVRVRSGSIGASQAHTPVPNHPPASPFGGPIREEFNDASMPALVNAV